MTYKVAIVAALLLGVSAPAGAWAQGRGAPVQPPPERAEPAPPPKAKERELVPMAQVEANLRRQVPGRLLEAKTVPGRNGPEYQINWSTSDGHRIDFIVDALTGRIIGRSGG